MKSLVCSDIHDHLENLRKALAAGAQSGISSVICCGDLNSPFVLEEFANICEVPVHIVFGNNDGDRFTMSQKINIRNLENPAAAPIFLHGEYLSKKRGQPLAGIPTEKGLFVTHYPQIARQVAYSPESDVVLYGHDHQSHSEFISTTLLANPGSLMGYQPALRQYIDPTYMILDWNNKSVQLLTVK